MVRKLLAAALVVAGGVLLLGALPAVTAEEQEVKKAPEFELFGVDYKYHSLEKYQDKKAIVVVFTCNHCPVAVAYEDTLISIAKEYQPKGIQFIAVNPNPADMIPGDGFPQMIERAKEKELPYPYVYDETQKTARAYGATVTPHIFVVDAEGNIVYEGAVDNHHNEPNYLADALDAILEGEEIETPQSKQFGCSVKYRPEKKQEQD